MPKDQGVLRNVLELVGTYTDRASAARAVGDHTYVSLFGVEMSTGNSSKPAKYCWHSDSSLSMSKTGLARRLGKCEVAEGCSISLDWSSRAATVRQKCDVAAKLELAKLQQNEALLLRTASKKVSMTLTGS